MFKTTLLATMVYDAVNAIDLENRETISRDSKSLQGFFPGLDTLREEDKRLIDLRRRTKKRKIRGIDTANSFLNLWGDNDHGWKQSSAHLVEKEDLRPYDDFFFYDNPRFGGFFQGREDCDLLPKYLFEDEHYTSK